MKVLGVVLDRHLTFHKHRLNGCSIVQLLCAGHPSHQTSSIYGVSTDVRTKPDRVHGRRNAVLQGAPTGTTQKLCVFRTVQLGLCSGRRLTRGDPTPSRYCTSCICCQSSSGLHTSWQFWRTKFGAHPLRFSYTVECWIMKCPQPNHQHHRFSFNQPFSKDHSRLSLVPHRSAKAEPMAVAGVTT